MENYPDEIWFQFLIYLSRFIDRRVSRSGKHSAQVAYYVKATARKIKLSEIEAQSLFWAALFHDIGKLGVPESVLSKPGPLTDEEWDLIKLHPTIGATIINSLDHISHITPAIYSHQEKFDGTGYPQGLRGEEIPIGARILAVADAYQAMTEDRYYRDAYSHAEARQELTRMGGKQFDAKVVSAFLEVIDSNQISTSLPI